ncbi:MAG: SGNH/GDSL hydrolase family protein [Candidatus Hydrogenedentota bacterium]
MKLKFLIRIAILFFSFVISLIIIEFILRNTRWGQDGKFNSMYVYKKSKYSYYGLKNNFKVLYKNIEYSTNSFGLRGEEFKLDDLKDKYVIIGLGDSIMMGYNLSEKDTFLYQLGLLLNTFNEDRRFFTINQGVSGMNLTGSIQRFYDLNSDEFNPQMIIHQILIDDFILYKEEEKLQNKPLINHIKEFVKSNMYGIYFLLKYSMQKLNIYKTYGVSVSENESYYDKIFKVHTSDLEISQNEIINLKRYCDSKGYILIYVIFPVLESSKEYQYTSYHKIWDDFFEKNNILYIDLINHLSSDNLNEYKLTDEDKVHPNAFATQLFAKIIYQNIIIHLYFSRK